MDLKNIFSNLLEINRALEIIENDIEIRIDLNNNDYEKALFKLIVLLAFEIELSHLLSPNQRKRYILKLLLLLEKLYLRNIVIEDIIREYMDILIRYIYIIKDHSLKFKDMGKWKEIQAKMQNLILNLS